MTALRTILGILIGLAVSGLSVGGLAALLGGDAAATAVVGIAFGVLGGIYSGIAFFRGTYGLGFFSILGLALDLTWSMLNTIAGLLVWLPACAVVGKAIPPDANSRRSGTFVYDKNPRGGGYSATTIGTVIGGGWDSHEETHVWQARIFGPTYMLVYILSLLLNMLTRLCMGKLGDLTMQAYYRTCFEDWAYWAGTSSASIRWPGWVGGFFLCLVYVACVAFLPFGIALGPWPLAVVGGGLWLAALIVRNLLPHGH
jgi:hypothetical protein